jgi:hypothetical protein
VLKSALLASRCRLLESKCNNRHCPYSNALASLLRRTSTPMLAWVDGLNQICRSEDTLFMPGSLSTQTHTVFTTARAFNNNHRRSDTSKRPIYSVDLPSKAMRLRRKSHQAPTAKGQLMMVDGTSARARRRGHVVAFPFSSPRSHPPRHHYTPPSTGLPPVACPLFALAVNAARWTKG